MFESGHRLLLYLQTEPKTEETAFSVPLTDFFGGQIHETDIQSLFSNKEDLFSNLMWNLVGGVYKKWKRITNDHMSNKNRVLDEKTLWILI